ncbi:hypothetical protein Tco_0708405 [Tanacetum coccineum]
MLVQPTDDEGVNSERPSDTLPTPSPPHFSEVPVEPQSDPSPRPLPSTIIHDSIPESSGGNLGDQAKEIQHLKAHIKKLKKQAKPVVKHHKAWLNEFPSLKQRLARKRSSKKQWVHRESVSKQGRKFAKGTDEQAKGTDDQYEGEGLLKHQPPTQQYLEMMKTIAHVLLNIVNISSFKREGERKHQHLDLKTKKFEEIQALYEKIKRSDEDFISIGSAEDERLIKKMNEKGIDSSKNEMVKEEDKEEEGTKKRKGGHIKMIARKKARKQSDVDSEDEHKKCLKIVTFESILDSEIMEKKSVIARLNKVSSPDGDYLVIYRANGNFRAFNYLMEELHILIGKKLFHPIVTWRLYESCGVCILEFEDGIVIHMLVERRYPLSKDLMQRMLDLGLEVERESSVALDLIRHKNWLVHKQTACGKDFSNPFMVDNLPKIIGFSTHLALLVKSWLVQDQTVLGTQGELNADALYFDSPSNDVDNGESKSAVDDQKQVEDGSDNENDEKHKSKDYSSPKEVNTAGQHVNTASSKVNIGCIKLNIVDLSVNTTSSSDPNSPKDMFTMGASHTLEATHVEFFSDEDEPEIEPTSIAKALSDSSWVEAMQEELLQFKLQQVWKLVDFPNGERAIGTK